MDEKVERYYLLKQQHKEIEQELLRLRSEITTYCTAQELTDAEIGGYKVKLVQQDRKEFDDQKLYAALPDPGVWRMLSKADPAKIASLIKLNVISEAAIQHTYTVKTITLLQVDKR